MLVAEVENPCFHYHGSTPTMTAGSIIATNVPFVKQSGGCFYKYFLKNYLSGSIVFREDYVVGGENELG